MRRFTVECARLSQRMAWTFFICLAAVAAANLLRPSLAHPASRPQTPQSPQAGVAQQAVGAIKSITGNTIILKTDAGADLTVLASDATRIVRVAPGQTDLKSAVPIKIPDLQVGDRILVRGKLSDDTKSIVASGVIVMKRSDVDAKQERDRQDWQKHGIAGIVTSVEPGAKTITISLPGPAGNTSVIVQVAKDTILRRYAPDSVEFDEAKPSTLDQVKPGDQLRARGAHNADGTEFAAEEIVSGAFRNIAGLLTAVDPVANTVTVNDLLTKKPILVKVTAQSQVVKLPPQIAQGVAARLKGAAPGTASSGGRATPPAPQESSQRPGGNGAATNGAAANSAATAGRQSGAQADLQQMLSRMPKATLADFQKGDAVMIVSTEGTAAGGVTAITLLGGVEPFLTASPAGGQPMTLSPWSIGGGGAGDAGAANPQ